jgi:hypothetical protein
MEAAHDATASSRVPLGATRNMPLAARLRLSDPQSGSGGHIERHDDLRHRRPLVTKEMSNSSSTTPPPVGPM